MSASLASSSITSPGQSNRSRNNNSTNPPPHALTIPNPRVKINPPDFPKVPRWRNWQTRYVQVVVVARPWRFESSPGHHPLPNHVIPTRLSARNPSQPLIQAPKKNLASPPRRNVAQVFRPEAFR